MENVKHICMQIKEARTDAEILKCREVMKVLRPHLEEKSFLPLVQELMKEGYRLVFIEENDSAVSAIGFRYVQYLFNGKQFYIDDLTTLPEYRGKGYGGKLLDYVTALAKNEGFKTISLDSGYQRNDAHRLYLNKGFVMASHHFIKTIQQDA